MRKNTITPISEMGARAPEAGRIRLGMQVKAASGKMRPTSIETFRFTSPMRNLIEQCAEQWGGQVQPWEKQWQVLSDANAIPVVLLPDGISQDYELWSGGGCQRRCDGVTCQQPMPVSDYDYEMVDVPCICGAKGVRECTAKTRLQVILPTLSFAGVWRLETGGWNAAEELPGMYEAIVALSERTMTQAILSLEMRDKVVTTKKGAQTRHFVVPRLSVAQNIAELAAGMASLTAIGTGTSPATAPALGPGGGGAINLPEGRMDLLSGQFTPVEDDIVEAEIVDVELEAALTELAEYFGLDPERFMVGVKRKAKGDIDNMWKAVARMKAGELAALGFHADGSIQWQS
jgi:hypothetical protein